MSDLDAVLARADANLASSLATLFDLVRIKSISTDPAYREDCRAAVAYLVRYLNGLGFDASVRETAGVLREAVSAANWMSLVVDGLTPTEAPRPGPAPTDLTKRFDVDPVA